MHRRYMTLEVVAAVCDVATVGAGEELPSERVADKHGQLQVVPVDEWRLQLGHL